MGHQLVLALLKSRKKKKDSANQQQCIIMGHQQCIINILWTNGSLGGFRGFQGLKTHLSGTCALFSQALMAALQAMVLGWTCRCPHHVGAPWWIPVDFVHVCCLKKAILWIKSRIFGQSYGCIWCKCGIISHILMVTLGKMGKMMGQWIGLLERKRIKKELDLIRINTHPTPL